MQAPHIFTVHVFMTVDGARTLAVHHVAGMSSADAEARIKASHAEHLHGRCFITTDEIEARYGTGVKTYTTAMRDGGAISDAVFASWVRAMTRPSLADRMNLIIAKHYPGALPAPK